MKILVYGWYHQGNIGDDLFIEAYRHLFPNYEFIFTDTIKASQLENIDAVFFGGGSFLLGRPLISEEALKKLKSKKIFYLGIGVESEIHPIHLELMAQAQMIATRSPEQINRLKLLCKNVSFVPDLIYSLQSKVQSSPPSNNSVLIMPNISVLPHKADPYWKHAAWAYFKSEFSQFMDWLVDNGYNPHLFAMCQATKLDDSWVSAELVGHMENRDQHYIYSPEDRPKNLEGLAKLFSKYNCVFTQRFHGIVLSEMTRTPYVAIHHHDKIKLTQPASGTFLSYYNSSKDSFISAFGQTIKMNFSETLPIKSSIFEIFSKEVTNLI